MKIKTFNKGADDAVNEFLAENTIIGFNILQDGDILVQYSDEVFTDKDRADYCKKELADNLRKQIALELDLAYEDGVEPDAGTGKRKRELQKRVDRLKVEEGILRKELA